MHRDERQLAEICAVLLRGAELRGSAALAATALNHWVISLALELSSFRQFLTVYPWLASNSQRFSCFSLLRAGVKHVYHHAQP